MKNQILKKPVARAGCSKRKMKKYKRTREMIREKFKIEERPYMKDFVNENLGIPWDEKKEIIIKKTPAMGMTEL